MQVLTLNESMQVHGATFWGELLAEELEELWDMVSDGAAAGGIAGVLAQMSGAVGASVTGVAAGAGAGAALYVGTEAGTFIYNEYGMYMLDWIMPAYDPNEGAPPPPPPGEAIIYELDPYGGSWTPSFQDPFAGMGYGGMFGDGMWMAPTPGGSVTITEYGGGGWDDDC